MLGTVVNAVAILIGGALGLLFGKGISERFNDVIIKGAALAVVLVGFLNAFEVNDFLVLIFSIIIGGILGEAMKLEDKLNDLSDKLGSRFESGSFSEGFVTTTLLYCVGAMAILGSIESGLTGDHSILFAKSTIDGITAVVFAASLGVGVIFSAASVFVYQGSITLLAQVTKDLFTDEVIADISGVGGLLIVSIGINMIFGKKFKTANYIPAVFIPIVYYAVKGWLGF